MPNTVDGKGKYKYKSPTQTKPTVNPNKALKGTLLKGLRTRPKPVTSSKPQISMLEVCSKRIIAPVANSKAPTKMPRYPSPFRIFSADPFVKKLSSFEMATIPPKTKM